MTKVICGEEAWSQAYTKNKNECKRNAWVVFKTNDGNINFLSATESMEEIKNFCNSNRRHIIELGLRYKSHDIKHDIEGAEAVYVVKSMRASMADENMYCIVLGKLVDGKVHKVAYKTPELIELYNDIDPVEECFEEGLIFNETEKTKIIQ